MLDKFLATIITFNSWELWNNLFLYHEYFSIIQMFHILNIPVHNKVVYFVSNLTRVYFSSID